MRVLRWRLELLEWLLLVQRLLLIQKVTLKALRKLLEKDEVLRMPVF